ncbi:MAG: DUF4188 domain-containing protein [Bacteroidia bacterium]
MAKTINERKTVIMEDEFVVFLIGMRINKLWKINKWWPVAMAMPKMLKELYANREYGFLSAESWFGRTTILVQYWESFEKLDSYAKNQNAHHFPAWVAFNKKIRSNGDVGIWHETYIIRKNSAESFYNNMPPFGLGKVGKLINPAGKLSSAKARLKNENQAE